MSAATGLLAGALRSLRGAGLALAVAGIAALGVAAAPHGAPHPGSPAPALQLATDTSALHG